MRDDNNTSQNLTKEYDNLMKKINLALGIFCAIIFCFIIYAYIKVFSNDSSMTKYWIIGVLSIIIIITIYRIVNHDTYHAVSSYMKNERKLINLLWFFDFYRRDDDSDRNLNMVKYSLDDNPYIDRYVYGSITIYVMINLGYILLIISIYGFMSTYNNITLTCICLILGVFLIACPRLIAMIIINELTSEIQKRNNVISSSLISSKERKIVGSIVLLLLIALIIFSVTFYQRIGLHNLLLLDLLTITIMAALFYIICLIIKGVKLKKKIGKYKKKKLKNLEENKKIDNGEKYE